MRAVRALAVLWALTLIVFLIHDLSYFPWLSLDQVISVPMLVTLNFLACAAFIFRAQSRVLLALGGILILFTGFSWHSWLGALAPWVPWIAIGFAFSLQVPERYRFSLVAISLLMVNGATALHRMNLDYLNGVEFARAGMFARGFSPELQDVSAQYAQPAAWVWLAGTLIPICLALLRRWRQALFSFLFFGLLLVILYRVLFYGFFLLVCLWLYAAPTALSEWRTRWLPRRLSPLLVYFLCQAGFFSWYLFWYDSFIVWFFWMAATLAVVLAAKPGKVEWNVDWRAATKAAPFPLAILFVWLALPFFWAGLPAPFAATYFTAREIRNPPQITRSIPDAVRNCSDLRNSYALRWGYKVLQGESGCVSKTYR